MNEVLIQLQSESRQRALDEIANLQGKLLSAQKRLERGDSAKTLRFVADAGDLDGAIAEHHTLKKLIEMGQKHE